MTGRVRMLGAVVLVSLVASALSTSTLASASTKPRSLPAPVQVVPEPEGVTLADPEFEPLPGARAEFGRLGGAVYQIEVPRRWNGRLVLYMHGFEEFGPEAQATAPDFRRYLIGQGFAWGASSFSTTSLIPGRAADETAALWDSFAKKYGRPTRTYVTGLSMGGLASHIAAERYANRFDGALALCGSAGQTGGLIGTADYFKAAAFVAGVTQEELDASPDVNRLIGERILPALSDANAHEQFESIMLDLTGGPRAFGREGFHLEEETNWRRAGMAVAARIAPNRETPYRLGPRSEVESDAFNRAVIRLPVDAPAVRRFVAGNDITGELRMPLLTMHSTGDGQVPIEQARILRRRVAAAGREDLLVQRVVPDASHCGFTTPEQVAAFEALVRWVEDDVKPKGTDVRVRDLRELDRTFELTPRAGRAANAVPGARDRVVVRGEATLDGAALDARWLGGVVRKAGLVTPCNFNLPPVRRGRYELTVMAAAEARGCGGPGAEIVLWTYANETKVYSTDAVAWPGNGRAVRFDARFSSAEPDGAAPVTTELSGEVTRPDGRPLPPGTRVEASVGATRCGTASTKRVGNFAGYILAVVGPDSIPGCTAGGTITFRIDGRPAAETAVNELGAGEHLDLTRR